MVDNRESTLIDREVTVRELVGRFAAAAVIFGLGYLAGAQGDEEPAGQPEGWSNQQLMDICPLLTEYALDPVTVSGCEGATNEMFDEMARQHRPEQDSNN